jgi:hypothetical protein
MLRRGLGPATLLVAAAWPAANASASVPVSLVDSTVKATSGIAAGGAAASVVSAKVTAITEGVLKSMFLTKLKTVTAALLMLGFVTTGTGLSIGSLGAERPGTPRDLQHKGPPKSTTALAVAYAVRQEPGQASPTWKIGPTLQGHGGQVSHVAFSPDGKRLASGSRDKSVVVWDVAKRDSLQTLSCAGEVMAVAFAPTARP